MRLADKSIVITGATGIAAAAARRAAAEGATVFVVSLAEEDCHHLVSGIRGSGGKAGYAKADLMVETEAETALEQATAFLDGIDGLFAVAGGSGRGFGDGPAHETPLSGWEKTLAINTFPMFTATSRVIEGMRGRGGSIVVISSVLAESPSPRLFATHAYAAAKGAANAYVRALSAYYAPDGIRVNGIAPGLVHTPMSERAAGDPETVEYARRKQPLADGLLDASHIADLAVFLLSDEASQITGQLIAVDGGWSVTEA